MKNYEIMFIVKPNLEEDATKVIADNMKKVLEENGAKILDIKNMGRRELAYEINTFRNGSYFLITLESEAKAIKEFDRVANISEDIIRHLIVNKEN